MSKLVDKALKFTEKKHENQLRKYSKENYIVHPKRVSEIIKKYKKSHKINELIAAALLHDTLEDTNTNIKELREKFGKLITSLVLQLTSDDEEIKKQGKTKYLSKKLSNSKKVSSWGLVIKLADRLDNVSDLEKSPKEFQERYKRETREIIKELESKRKLSATQQELIKEIKNKIKD